MKKREESFIRELVELRAFKKSIKEVESKGVFIRLSDKDLEDYSNYAKIHNIDLKTYLKIVLQNTIAIYRSKEDFVFEERKPRKLRVL